MKIYDLKKFNEAGERKYRELLSNLPGSLGADLANLVKDPTYTIQANIPNFEKEIPSTRREVGELLYPYLGPGRAFRSFASDKNLWNWLSAVYLSGLAGSSQSLAASRKDAWLLNDNSNRYYRNVMFSAYFVYENHEDDPDSVSLLLSKPLNVTLGEYGEQILATADIAYSVGARVANHLYLESATGNPKIGASSKSPGSVRRLTGAFLNQIKLNVDFKAMSVSQIVALLPAEFSKYVKGETSLGSGSKDFSDEEMRRFLGL